MNAWGAQMRVSLSFFGVAVMVATSGCPFIDLFVGNEGEQGVCSTDITPLEEEICDAQVACIDDSGSIYKRFCGPVATLELYRHPSVSCSGDTSESGECVAYCSCSQLRESYQQCVLEKAHCVEDYLGGYTYVLGTSDDDDIDGECAGHLERYYDCLSYENADNGDG